MGQHRSSKKYKPPKDMIVVIKDVKIRKRIAPGCRVIKSDKDKERKHKVDYTEDMDDE